MKKPLTPEQKLIKKAKDKIYRDANKTKAKTWRDDNKLKSKEANKKWRDDNKEHKSKLDKEYKKKNKEKIQEQNKIYYKERLKNDPLFRLTTYLRSMIGVSFKNKGIKKNSKTSIILGCSFDNFRQYIEAQFEPWMTWDNRGLFNGTLNYGWDIDHIEPLCNAKTEADLIRLNHYTNLRPLCGYYNRHIKRGLI